MPIKFDSVKPGEWLYDVHSIKVGNTKMSRLGWWPVKVLSVDPVKRRAVVSWNGNRPETYCESGICRLRRSIPKKLAPDGNVKPYGDGECETAGDAGEGE